MVTESLPANESRRSRLGVVMVLSNMQLPLGGTQKQLLGLANELDAQGVPVSIVSRRQKIFKITRGGYGTAISSEAVNTKVRFVHLPILRLQPAWSFLFSFLFWAVMNRRRFQIIHAHSPRLGVIASIVGWLMRKPVIIKVPSVEHAGDMRGGRFVNRVRRRILTEGSAGFVAISRELADHLRDAGISPRKIALIPNGVEVHGRNGDAAGRDQSRPDSDDPAFKAELLGSSEVRVVLFVGRLIEEKGLDQLLTVWASLPARHGAVLLIAGDGPLRKDLESRVQDLEIVSSVRFLGHQPEVSKFYAIADLFVLPSKTEGMSNALLEAMSMGLPVVASDIGGNKDVLEDESGVLTDWNNIPHCVDMLTTLLSDANLRSRLGECARRRALDFNLPSIANQYRRLYESVLHD